MNLDFCSTHFFVSNAHCASLYVKLLLIAVSDTEIKFKS